MNSIADSDQLLTGPVSKLHTLSTGRDSWILLFGRNIQYTCPIVLEVLEAQFPRTLRSHAEELFTPRIVYIIYGTVGPSHEERFQVH